MQRERIRIIGGDWRGRLLDVAHEPGLRPSGDRIRETLFNWLQQDIAGSCCLDLFAGTGALGFEAASRGAARVHLVERSSPICAELERQMGQLVPDKHPTTPNPSIISPPFVAVHCRDALDLLESGPAEPESTREPTAADIVFVDPPFADGTQQQVLQLVHQHGWLKPHGQVYVEREKGSLETILPDGWIIHREKNAGRVTFGLVHPVSAYTG